MHRRIGSKVKTALYHGEVHNSGLYTPGRRSKVEISKDKGCLHYVLLKSSSFK